MANTFKFGNGNWAVKDGYALAYNDENNNFKPLPFDFTRASSATRVNKQGLIETVGSGKPRIDFTDNTSGHLLLEPSRTNLFPYSEDFSEWSSASGGSVSQSQEGVGGSTDAFEFTSDGSANSRIFYNISATGTHSFSVFAKKNTLDYISLYANDDSNSRVWFNLANGTLGNQEAGGTGTIEDYGGGWYRCTLKWNSSNLVNIRIYNSNENDVVGGTSGSVYIQYAQLEVGSYATSYIPTEGSSVTRVAETNEQTLITDVLDTDYNTGAMYAEFKLGQDSITRFMSIIGTFWTTTSVRMELTPNTSAGFIGEIVQSGVGSSITGVSTVGITSGDVVKCAMSWDNGTLKIALNGTVSTGTCPVMTTRPTDLYLNLLGTFSGTGQNEKNEFRDIKLYNTALTDTELQNLTS